MLSISSWETEYFGSMSLTLDWYCVIRVLNRVLVEEPVLCLEIISSADWFVMPRIIFMMTRRSSSLNLNCEIELAE